MKKEDARVDFLTKAERIVFIIVAVCVCLQIGAHIGRREAEQCILREQKIYVEPDGVYVEYRGKIYKHE